jgi:hypothetical protein
MSRIDFRDITDAGLAGVADPGTETILLAPGKAPETGQA